MEEEMVENEEEVEYTFTAYEIDLDYEFDAARFFDFKRDETHLETHQAELWFESAGSYPPSPFVTKLLPREEMSMENINISPKCKGIESMNLCESNPDVEADGEPLDMEMNYEDGGDQWTSSTAHVDSQQKFHNQSQRLPSGLTFYNHMADVVKSENPTKLSMKPTFPRTSTLMKPTASQLAKQNRPFQAGFSRPNTSQSSANTCVVENQAAKRQKLEGGLLRKVMGTVQQQTNFVHKVPKQVFQINGSTTNSKYVEPVSKGPIISNYSTRGSLLSNDMQDGLHDRKSTHTNLKITIPKDPNLETAHRAQRVKSSKEEKVTSTVRRFKALQLNRKILEAPSLLPKRSTPRPPEFQEFHLKTSERAMQHSSGVLKSTVSCNHSYKDSQRCRTNITTDCGNRDPGRPSLINNVASRPDSSQCSQSFKAIPLNKKILTSKGDIGMFRNIKKETTVPMEFNFQTEKRFRDNPPIELFNNLSLACETRATNSESKAPRSISISAKGSKENRLGSFQQANEIKQPAKLRLPLIEGKPPFSNELKNEVSSSSGISWVKPMRYV